MIKDDKTIWMQIAPFKQALKDDADAEGLIGKAIISLSEFYKNNMIPLEFMQKQQCLEYKVNKNKTPVTSSYGSQAESDEIIVAPWKYDAEAGDQIGKVILSEFMKFVQKKEYKVDKDKEIVVLKDGNANQSKISGWYDFCSDGESGGLVRGHRLDPVVHLVHLICSRSTLHGVLADWKAPVTSFFDAFCINLRFIK